MVLDAEADRLRLEAFDTFFEMTFNQSTRPPHHLIAFGYKHLWRDPEAEKDPRAKKPLPLLWPPRRIARELSDEALRTVQNQLEAGLFETFQLPPSRLEGHLSELRQWMGQTVAEVVKQIHTHTGRSGKSWADTFANNVVQQEGIEPTDDTRAEAQMKWQVGETCFRQHYTRTPEDNITSWCYSVWRRVSGAIFEQGQGELFELLLQAKRYESQSLGGL